MEKRILQLVLCLATCLVSVLPASAYSFMKDGIYYNISGSNATVTYKDANYNSYSGTVIIPASVTNNGTTYNVTAIGPSAFEGCTDLKRVVLPNTINYIMNNAFYGCTMLSNITLPASVYTMYNNVFSGCTSLRTVISLKTTPPSTSASAFDSNIYGYAKLLVPSGCTHAYQSNSVWGNFNELEEIECSFVQDAIFYEDLGNNHAAVRNVSEYTECYSGDIVIPQTVTNNGQTYTVTSVQFGAFYYGYLMTSVVLPNTVTEIGIYAFFDCSSLTSVNIPEGVREIGYCTFGDCTSLPSITIPASVEYINQNAFTECRALETITCQGTTPPQCSGTDCFYSANYQNATLRVPGSALSAYQTAPVWREFTNIEGRYYDFEANGIYYIITGPNTASVTYRDRNYNSYSGTVNVPSTVTHEGTTYTVTAVGRSAFYKSSGLTEVTLPNTITMLDYASFADCSSLTSIDIPSSVTSLGEFCFQGCSALEVVRIEGEITAIPRQCFTYCNSLHTLVWPSTIKEIGPFALYECRNLGSLILPEDLEIIQPYALSDCSSLGGIIIPGKVSFIDQGAFSGCTGLYYILVDQSNQHYMSIDGSLLNYARDTLIAYPNMYTQNFTIPSGVRVIGPAAFSSCDNLLSVSFPDGVTSIETSAFEGCKNLQTVSLCNSITDIGSAAFYFCESLTSFYIPANVATIGSGAFSRCSNMKLFMVDLNNPNFMTDDGVLYTIDGTRLVQYPSGRPDKHYSVLNTTTAIDDMAFAYAAVKSVYLPKSLRSLGYESFSNSQLQRLVIDEGLETIPDYAFYDCYDLKSVYLPSTIKSIGNQAFYYCLYLEDITIAVNGEVPTIGNYAFYGLAFYTDSRYAQVYVPSGMEQQYNGQDEWLEARGVFTAISPLETGTTFEVDSLTFDTTDDLLNVQVTGVTSEDIVDPGIAPKVAYQGNLCTVTLTGDRSFYRLNKIIRAEVPFTVQRIENYSFYECTNLEKLILRDGIKQIGGFSISHVNKLTNVEIPASVDSIRSDAFTYDPALRSINVNSGNTKYTSEDGILFSKDKKQLIAFADGYGPQYTVPDGTQSIEAAAFRGAQALEAVVLPNSLREIKNSAFFECTSLTEMVVPHGVTTIGTSAFNRCTAMTFADLPATLTVLDYNAFSNASSLTRLNVRATTPPACVTYIDPRSHQIYEPFNSNHYSNVELVVPQGCAQAYRDADIWKKFTNITETNFPAVFIRGDVNDDGIVNISDAIALINGLLNDNYSDINMDAADVNEDGAVNISDAVTLINYLLNDTWPDPAPIDMWYLWGNFIGENIWGDNNGMTNIGSSALPLYPTGDFNLQGKGILTWTGFIPRQYFTIVHSTGYYDAVVSEMWVKDLNTGQYCVKDMTEDDPNYSSFLLEADYYTITLDTKNMTLSIEPYSGDQSAIYSFGSITIAGYFNEWSNRENPLSWVNSRLGLDNHDWYIDEFTVDNDNLYFGEVKFCAYDDWTYNWGSADFPYGKGVQDGLNIPAKVGTYIVFFNDITGQYNFIKK